MLGRSIWLGGTIAAPVLALRAWRAGANPGLAALAATVAGLDLLGIVAVIVIAVL